MVLREPGAKKLIPLITMIVVSFLVVFIYSDNINKQSKSDPQENNLVMSSTQNVTSDNSVTQDIQAKQDNYNKNIEQSHDNTTKDIVTIKKGDNLNKILQAQQLPSQDVKQLIALAQNEKITQRLKIGQKIAFEYDLTLIENNESDLNKEQRILSKMSIKQDKIRSLDFLRQEDGKFIAKQAVVPMKKMITKYNATVDTSVINALKKEGLSTNSIIELIEAFSHKVDFQRQIKPGDQITVITEKYVTSSGSEFSHHGNILYAAIKTKNKEHKIYRFNSDKAKGDYPFFSEQGETAKSAILRTPLKYYRISGKFGYRKKHPVHGYGKMHPGVDFAAPKNTPIKAAGDGKIEYIGWSTGYGRLVVIIHNNKLQTAYANASKFAKCLKKGTKVKQGDTIAYVGRSGTATGYHLHFEVRQRKKGKMVKVNPMTFKLTPAIILKGKDLKRFNKFKADIKELNAKLDKEIELAEYEVRDILVGTN
ncbi:MAG: peptidoglycan DD-metalloendopeptidase family protein [Rickettsiaceae bacterium]|nr:peptidoglycan DD-metalloendopeptidase family protein [Rickettsiaceae bacterium]